MTSRWRPAEHAGRRGLAGTVLVHKIAGAAARPGCRWRRSPRGPGGRRRRADDGRGADALHGPGRGPARLLAGRGRDRVGPGHPRRARRAPRPAGAGRRPGGRCSAGSSASRQSRLVAGRADGQQPGRHAGDGAGHRRAPGRGRRRRAGQAVERVYLGTFLSALEMAGVSLTVLPVTPEDRSARRPDGCAGLARGPGPPAREAAEPPAPVESGAPPGRRPPPRRRDGPWAQALSRVAEALLAAEPA